MKLQVPQREKGMALVITLVMLAIVTVMAVVFLALSRREREGVKISEEQAVTRLMTDSAQAHAEAEMVGRIIQAAESEWARQLDTRGGGANTNMQHVLHGNGSLQRARFHYDLLSSKAFEREQGFIPNLASPTNVNYVDERGIPLSGRNALQNLANMQYRARPPVYIQVQGESTNRFLYYLDLNRNGMYETNGVVQVTVPITPDYRDANGNRIFERMVGDPEWIGVLERPDLPHSETNRFIGRYAFIVIPEGKTLDLNYIHNMSATSREDLVGDGSADDRSSDFQYRRNQGIGPWELNLAGFLVDLHTNIWRPNFRDVYYYSPSLTPGNLGESSGTAFQSAFHLLKHRMNISRANFYRPNEIFRTTEWWNRDYIDQHGDGPLIPYQAIYRERDLDPRLIRDGILRDDDFPGRSWHGLERPERVKDFAHAQSIYTDAANFTPFFSLFSTHIGTDSTKTNSYDRYTYYRLLAQMGSDSKPVGDTRIHLNHPSLPLSTISTNIGAETNSWVDTAIPIQFAPWESPTNRLDPALWFDMTPTNQIRPRTNFFMLAADAMLKASMYTNVFIETLTDEYGRNVDRNGRLILPGQLPVLAADVTTEDDSVWQTNYTIGGPYYPQGLGWETNWSNWQRRPINTPVRKEISVNDIQIFRRPQGVLPMNRIWHGRTNNEYTPAVHRILQVAANIYDNMTNKTVFPYDNDRGEGPINQVATPTVFRPHYARVGDSGTQAGYLRIINWLTDTNSLIVGNTNNWISANDYWVLTARQPPPPRIVIGQPLVIGVKKGWPNFNELSVETHLQLTRKLEAVRVNRTTTNGMDFRQMFILGVSNVFGIEAWNSYAQRLKRGIELKARIESDIGIHIIRPNLSRPPWFVETNRIWFRRHVFSTNSFRIPASPGWPGRQSLVYSNEIARARIPGDPAPMEETDFRIPVYGQVITLPSESVFVNPGPGIMPQFSTNVLLGFQPIALETNGVPDFLLTMTNRVTYVAIDMASERVIDFVSLDKLVTTRRLRDDLLEVQNAGQAATGGTGGTNSSSFNPGSFWDIRPSGVTLGAANTPISLGLLAQLLVSMGEPMVDDALWRTFSVLPPGNDKEYSIDYFRQFLGTYPLDQENVWGRNAPQSLRHQAPFSPTRRLYIHTKYQANDPLVHFTEQDLMFPRDLRLFTGDTNEPGGTRPIAVTPGQVPVNTDLGRVNERYARWAGWVQPEIKDPGVFSSDDWDFTSVRMDTNNFHFKYPNVGSLGSIHRGTPWQSLYMKAATVSMTNWQNYSGLYHSEPYRDWLLFGLFTTAPLENGTRGLLSVNQTNMAAWSAVLSGVQVISNTVPDLTIDLNPRVPKTFADMFIEPGSLQLSNIVKSINAYRATRPLGKFAFMGEVLGASALSYGGRDTNTIPIGMSPFMNMKGTNQLVHAFTDEVMEKIPRQIMSLLKADEPRFTVYAFGQALRPAPRSLSTDGDFYNLVQNYQVTGEYATKAVVRVDGEVKNPANPLRTVVEKFEPLPPLD